MKFLTVQIAGTFRRLRIKNHLAVFPKELCRKILKYYSFRGDVVLDPFAGCGTFGEVAIEMKNHSHEDIISQFKKNSFKVRNSI